MDTQTWDNLTRGSVEALDVARDRIRHLFATDPFVRMLDEHVRETMLDAIMVRALTGYRGGLASSSRNAVRVHVKRAVKVMPLGFLTEDFKTHLTDLVALAVTPRPSDDDL